MITRFSGDRFSGLSSDAKPTTVVDGAIFIETDTEDIYHKVAGVWESLTDKYLEATTAETIYVNLTTAQSIAGVKTFLAYSQTNGRLKAVTTKTADYTATANDETIKFTSNATLTLPSATGSGQHYLVRAVDCTVVIDGNGTDTINEELTQTLLAGDGVQIVDDGAGTWGVY